MATKRKTTDAVAILHRRYVKNNMERRKSLQAERVHAQVAGAIYEARQAAGMSQAQLAECVGTTQSVISRLEDADYDGHSLTMLARIAAALGRGLTIAMPPRKRSGVLAKVPA